VKQIREDGVSKLKKMESKITIRIYILIIACLLPFSKVKPQEGDCNKTKIAVSVEIVPGTDIYNMLESDFGAHAGNEWNGFATKMLVQTLSENEPEITFFSVGEGGEDCHYFFKANMDLITVGEENDEHTGYWISASLTANANCIPNRNWVVAADADRGKDRALKQAMKNLVSDFWPMDRNIISYEKDHPSPPRDPELNIEIKKDFLSPLDKESRKTKVNAKVYDCRGNIVCDKNGHGQPVYYQDEMDRLDLKIGHCEGGYHIGNFMVIITNKDCNNEAEYKLEKGIDAEKKNIRFKTCQLGGGPLVEKEKELIIRGLKIEVKPDRREIEPDEHAKIIITFNETDPDGSKYPLEGKEIDVKINGLVNGTIKPVNGYTTNSDGKIVLNYKAGSNDEKITVNASFQPEDYPDKAEGKGSVTVKSPEYDAKLNLKKTYDKTLTTSYNDISSKEVHKHNLKESIEASATVYLTLIESQDMPVLNQTWQYFKPTSVSIPEINYNSTENKYSSGPKYETNVDYYRSLIKQELDGKETVKQLPWMLVIDNETKKAVKLIPAGYGITYEINETEKLNSTVYSDQGPEKRSSTTTKTSSKSFALGPVGEEIQDNTIKKSDTWMQDYLKKQGVELPAGVTIPKISNEETIKKIQPDILVKFGDGKTSFGGEGTRKIRKELEHGYQEENLHYSWNMTVKKKK